MKTIKIGTRGSRLALWQAKHIKKKLSSGFSHINFKIEIIKTEGDRDQSSSLTQIGGQGIFTKAIEDALLGNMIDIAVHSLKDLPSRLTEGTVLAAVPERGDVEDVLITKEGNELNDLPENAVIGTGSIRRRCQLLHIRNDLKMTDLRGNIDTRLDKLYSGKYDGIVMAKAAIKRLGIDNIKYRTLDHEIMIPAVGQGAIGVEVRQQDKEIIKMVKEINHSQSHSATQAERAFLYKLDTGCQFPVGAIAHVSNNTITIEGFTGTEDGDIILKEKISAPSAHAVESGILLAETLIKRGALKLLHGE